VVSLDGVAPSRMVGVSASVNLPLHHNVQKFSSGSGSPGWSWKKGRKTVVVVVVTVTKFGEWAFSFADSTTWNSLPCDIRHITDTAVLWSPYVIGRPYIFLCCGLFFFLLSSFFFFPRLISAAADWMSTILRHMVWS